KYSLPTVSDIDLILGYLNEEYFLGGKVELDKGQALKEVEDRLARPLGLNVYELGSRILDLLHSQMKDLIYAKLLSRGYNPAEYTLLVYGGSGPLHMWGTCEGLGFREILTLPWAAAFSAFGIAASEYLHRYHKGVVSLYSPSQDTTAKLETAKPLNKGWRELEEKALTDFREEGISTDRIAFRYGVYARYLGQIDSFEVPLSLGQIENPEDMDQVIAEFEMAYTAIYPKAARYPQSGYFISEVFLEAVADRTRPHIPRYPLSPPSPKNGYKGRRQVYHLDRWEDFSIWEMDQLAAGNEIEGPAIIEHPMTTLVIPPEKKVVFDEHRLIRYQSNS
ncbi:MAG: hydantoinase/oxoprolinase family protein, partial [Candidatus Binatia bacterium]|nr:hydantoinase/oxoprolinase family protein [Candidatus Binatia bacterium]